MRKKKKTLLDDFPLDNFDNTQFSAEQRLDKRTFKVAWSNVSLELWFVLHFQELSSNTEIAINRAKKQYESYPPDTPASKRCPATRVFELVEELKQYL